MTLMHWRARMAIAAWLRQSRCYTQDIIHAGGGAVKAGRLETATARGLASLRLDGGLSTEAPPGDAIPARHVLDLGVRAARGQIIE